MSEETTTANHAAIIEDRVYQFWFLQAGFWIGLSVVSFFTLTVWYGQFSWNYIAHTLLQSVMGLLLSLPLYWIFIKIWDAVATRRFTIGIVSVLLFSLLWTAARISVFIVLTTEDDVWKDFGGWYFGSIFIFLCWASLLHGVRYYQLLQFEHKMMLEVEAIGMNEQLKAMKAQTEARDAQLKMLRYQLNPHFLCNTLNGVNSLIQMQEHRKAQRMIVQLSHFLRYSLDNNPDTKIPLETEIRALMLYLEIEKTRFGERLKLDFHISDSAKSALVPSLLLQPLIENSMKYSVAKSEDGGTISLSAYTDEQRLLLELSDTGSDTKIGKSKIESSNGRGVGLRNTDERLKALYEDDYEFSLQAMPSGGLKSIIRIPYQQL